MLQNSFMNFIQLIELINDISYKIQTYHKGEEYIL